MALSITITVGWPRVAGPMYVIGGTLDFDNSYPTNGEPLTAADVSLSTLDFVLISPQDGLFFEYDYTNETVKAFEQGFITGSTAAGAASNATNVEDFAGSETAWEAPGVAIDTTIRFGAMKEVADTTDLSSITGVRFLAFGT